MSKFYPYVLDSDAYKHPLESMSVAKYSWSAAEAVAADDDGILEATAVKTTEQVITAFAAQPPCARNITVKSTGTATDLAAGKIIVYGTNMAGDAISEEIDVTADTAVNFTGDKAFESITKVVIPGQDGTGASIKIGWGVKYGLPVKISGDLLIWGFENGSLQATPPTVTADGNELEKNVVSFSQAPRGNATSLFFMI